MSKRALVACVTVALLALPACSKEEKKDEQDHILVPASPSPSPTAAPKIELPPAPPIPDPPAGLESMELKVPEDNPLTPEKVALGELLFFDKRLSKDGSAACETCHLHEKGWVDGQKLSIKVGGAANTRNTPTLYNVGYQTLWYWDGRSKTLEEQILAAWKGQMGAEPDKVAAAIAGIPEYKAHFQRAFSADPSGDDIVKALASFIRTLRSGGSAWDRYEKTLDKSLVSADAIAGYKVFTERAGCAQCHTPPLYTDLIFHNVGVGYGDDPKAAPADPGRGKLDPAMMGAFKTPTLRSVTKTGPWLHDGSAETLEAAVKFFASGGKPNPSLDKNLHDAKLSDKEIAQLIEFLKALESDEPFEKPSKLPQAE